MIIALFLAMASTDENKFQKQEETLKISHKMAEEAMASRVRPTVSKDIFIYGQSPIKIPVKCPISYYEWQRNLAASLGGEHALKCHGVPAFCGRMVSDAALDDEGFYMLEEFAGRMANAGRPVRDQVVWNIYSDTLTYKDFEHMSYDKEGKEAGVKIHQRRQASTALGSFEDNKAVFNPKFYEIFMRHLLQTVPNHCKIHLRLLSF